jgi:hypothetical protein
LKYRLTLEMDQDEIDFVRPEWCGRDPGTYEIIDLMRDYAETRPESLERIPEGGEQDVLPLPQA